MARLFRVTEYSSKGEGQAVIVNADRIECVRRNGDGSAQIVLRRECIYTVESFEEVRERLIGVIYGKGAVM